MTNKPRFSDEDSELFRWLSLVIAIVVLAWFVYSMIVTEPNVEAARIIQAEQDRYEMVYNQCMSRETIEAERCHDIAICTVWGCDSGE